MIDALSINSTFTFGGDMTVRRVGYGAMHLTGRGMWGPPEDPQAAIRLLRRAIDLGVNFINTADAYGPGDNERIIREALHPYPDDLVICTKGGLLRSGPSDWSHEGPPYIVPLGRPAYLRQQVELSLRNLSIERIPLYLLHSIDPEVPLKDQLGELARLQGEGKIRHIGISGQPGVTIEELEASRRICAIVAVENLYNLADRADEPTLRHTEMTGSGYIPWFPLGHGGLVSAGGALTRIAADFGATASQLALAWLLHRSPATVLIPGTTSITHLEENAAASKIRLSASDVEAITRAADAANLETWRPER